MERSLSVFFWLIRRWLWFAEVIIILCKEIHRWRSRDSMLYSIVILTQNDIYDTFWMEFVRLEDDMIKVTFCHTCDTHDLASMRSLFYNMWHEFKIENCIDFTPVHGKRCIINIMITLHMMQIIVMKPFENCLFTCWTIIKKIFHGSLHANNMGFWWIKRYAWNWAA